MCAETPTSRDDCENHINYIHAVHTYLPPECADLHGKSVNREYIGAVRGTPLCERRPSASKMKCEASGAGRKYGLLHGKKGIPTPDLDAQQDIDFELTQQGLWDKMMMILLLFLQKQNLAFAVYQFGSVLSLPD
jgi:hypothetical protein